MAEGELEVDVEPAAEAADVGEDCALEEEEDEAGLLALGLVEPVALALAEAEAEAEDDGELVDVDDDAEFEEAVDETKLVPLGLA